MPTAPCLFELGTQDLPAKQLSFIQEALAENIAKELRELGFTYSRIESFITPRRIAVLIHELPWKQPDKLIEKRGPAVSAAFQADGTPTPACIGFAKSCGVDVEALERLSTDKGICVGLTIAQAGKFSRELLPSLFETALKQLPLAKTMRWGSEDFSFTRPSQWCVLKHGNETIDGVILGQPCGHTTYGHRFHDPKAIQIDNVLEYPRLLEEAMVMANHGERMQKIRERLEALADLEKAEVLIEPELLEEVTGLVEWPEPLVASFDPKFLMVPKEALIAAMRDHQKSFALSSQGKLIPKFITVSNIRSHDPQRVIDGNERVMRARLSDAAFFYETDRKQRLESHLESTKQVVFQAKLGSLYEKAERLAHLTQHIGQSLHADLNASYRAGLLSKCDLMTSMVGEFPELQGIMGEDYAKLDGEEPAVAKALREYYYPAFAGDHIPSTTIGAALALADRFDTLLGTFGIGQKPTGVKDPFKCRRAALGIVRILIEGQYPLDILDILSATLQQYPSLSSQLDLIREVHEFILERLQAYYAEQDVPSDVLTAVLSRQNTVLHDLHQRIQAVLAFRELEAAPALAAANKRVSRLLQKEEHLDTHHPIDAGLLHDPAEQALGELIVNHKSTIHRLYEEGQYTQILQTLAGLREPIDRFFDHVMVNSEDAALRHNRLALLSELRRLFLQVADISLLQERA